MVEKSKKYNPLEKSTFFMGLLILSALTGYLVHQLIANDKTPPRLLVTIEHQSSVPGNGYKVEIENTGDTTAEEVQVKLGLYQNGEQVETATLNIQLIPAKSRETGWVFFGKARVTSDSLIVTSKTFLEPI